MKNISLEEYRNLIKKEVKVGITEKVDPKRGEYLGTFKGIDLYLK